MDAMRFGRALGFGARQAAKTVFRAVDAACAENPSAPPVAPQPQQRIAAAPTPQNRTMSSAPPRPVSGTTVVSGMKQGVGRFRASAVEPVVRLSGVLWLEVTGVFFGIFALSTAIAAWRLRSQWRAAIAHPIAHAGLLVAVAAFALFSYFCITSFVRAHRRERRRG